MPAVRRKAPSTQANAQVPDKKPTLDNSSSYWEYSPEDLEAYKADSDPSRVLRLVIPNPASVNLTDNIVQLENEDQVSIVMPTSVGNGRNIFITSTNETERIEQVDMHRINNVQVPEHDDMILKNLANVACRIATLIAEPCREYHIKTSNTSSKHPMVRDPELVQLRVLINQEQASSIIGKKGANINELRTSTGTTIKMFGDNCPEKKDRVLELCGAPEKLWNAMMIVCKRLRYTQLKNLRPDQYREYYNASQSYLGNLTDFGGYEIKNPDDPIIPGSAQSNLQGKGDSLFMPGTNNTLRFVIPKVLAGSLIGKKGAFISQLRSNHNVSVQTKDNKSEDRVVQIVTDSTSEENSQKILNCLEEILNKLGKELADFSSMNKCNTLKKGEGFGSDITEIRLLVNTSTVGVIVGRGGESIKEIRSNYNVEIRVYSLCCPNSNDRVVCVSGTVQEILACAKELLTIINNEKARESKGEQYDGVVIPEFDYNPFKYGGFIKNETKGYDTYQANENRFGQGVSNWSGQASGSSGWQNNNQNNQNPVQTMGNPMVQSFNMMQSMNNMYQQMCQMHQMTQSQMAQSQNMPQGMNQPHQNTPRNAPPPPAKDSKDEAKDMGLNESQYARLKKKFEMEMMDKMQNSVSSGKPNFRTQW